MSTASYPSLQVAVSGSVATVTLDRPEVHNAFDETLIASLAAAFRDLGARVDLRAVVLRGNGPSFSAGADVNWMRSSLNWPHEQNIADATALAHLFETINTCPLAVVGRIHGAAMGGGVGLVACCDIAIAAEDTRFAFSEVKLGLVPATISPYVIAKIGQTHARALFVTGERFDAARALAMGLVHRVVSADMLDAAVVATLKQLRSSGPRAIRAAKELALTVGDMPSDAVTSMTVETIASIRVTPEAQEGVRAFLEKRHATWVEGEQ